MKYEQRNSLSLARSVQKFPTAAEWWSVIISKEWSLFRSWFKYRILPSFSSAKPSSVCVQSTPNLLFIFHSLWLSHSLCPYKERQAGLMSSNEECLKNPEREEEGEKKRGPVRERECLACNKPGWAERERERTCLEGRMVSFLCTNRGRV